MIRHTRIAFTEWHFAPCVDLAKAGILLYVTAQKDIPKGGELSFIRALSRSAGVARGAVRLGIGDDCAILRPRRGEEMVVTTDFSLEGRHFRRDWHSGRSAGHRCLARGLSDIAAMGAKPVSAFLSLALPAGLRRNARGRKWINDFLAGLLDLASRTGTQLSGGDTATAPGDAILADIVLLGTAPTGRALRRSGAKPGDLLYVTGSLGGAAVELERLAAAPQRLRRAVADGNHPHLFPEPRLQAGQALLRKKLASAAMDLSDGLSTDLRHLCEASGVGAIVDAAAIPVHRLALARQHGALGLAMNGGEDYELLFTAPATQAIPRKLAGVAVTRIGEITEDKSVLLRTNTGLADLPRAGWEHSL